MPAGHGRFEHFSHYANYIIFPEYGNYFHGSEKLFGNTVDSNLPFFDYAPAGFDAISNFVACDSIYYLL